MNVCFLSSRPFGLLGTPGTYLFVKYAQEFFTTLVLAPENTQGVFDEQIPMLNVESISPLDLLGRMHELEDFSPDIFYIFNSHEWSDTAFFLRKAFPNAKIVLDIKTPLLLSGKALKNVQERGQFAQHTLDAIVTLSEESVESWIPGHTVPSVPYPLGVDCTLFPAASSIQARKNFQRFVYIGALNPRRRLPRLLSLFSEAAKHAKHPLYLDLYGKSLAGIAELEEQIPTLHPNAQVTIKGQLPQKELLKRLPEYDAGIAWVPSEVFSNSPSLKSLEFMGAGLPLLASNTEAHRALKNSGFSLSLFEQEGHGLTKALQELPQLSQQEQLRTNRTQLESFDYTALLRSSFVPLFKKLVQKKTTAPAPRPHKLTLTIMSDSLAAGKGGAERVSSELANEMARRGHRVYVCYKNTGHPAYPLTEGVIPLPYTSSKKLREALIALSPDLFFAFYFNRELLRYRKLVFGTGIPFGMQECTNPQRLEQTNWIEKKAPKTRFEIRAVEREAVAASAQAIRLVMPEYADSFPDYIQDSLAAFPNPSFVHETRAHQEPQGRYSIINIGGMKKNKNFITLLKAFHQIADEFPLWDIRVFGNTLEGPQPHKLEIKDYIEEHSLQERIHICGRTDDVFAEFLKSQIHVTASLSEGCPTCILEAMAVGVPSIGFAECPGTNQLIRHEHNGLLASGEDRVAALSQQLKALMSSTERRDQYGKAAHKDALGYSPDRTYDRWEKLFFTAASYKDRLHEHMQLQMRTDANRTLSSHRIIHSLLSTIDLD